MGSWLQSVKALWMAVGTHFPKRVMRSVTCTRHAHITHIIIFIMSRAVKINALTQVDSNIELMPLIFLSTINAQDDPPWFSYNSSRAAFCDFQVNGMADSNQGSM